MQLEPNAYTKFLPRRLPAIGCRPMKSLDEASKYLFDLRRMVESLLRLFGTQLGIPAELLARLDLERMTSGSTELIAPGLKKRLSDKVWIIPVRDGAPGEYLILLIEFQSTPDPTMLARIAWYGHMLRWLKADSLIPGGTNGTLTTVAPGVLYIGLRAWNAPTSSAAASPHGSGETGVEVSSAGARYGLLDILTLNPDALPDKEPMTWVVRIEHAETGVDIEATLERAIWTLRKEREDGELERALHAYAAASLWRLEKREIIPFEEVDERVRQRDNLGDENMDMSLGESNMIRWAAQTENEGWDRGLERGLARDRAQLRAQAAIRFDEATAERLSHLLDRINDFDRLDEIAKSIVSCETGDELLSHLNGSG